MHVQRSAKEPMQKTAGERSMNMCEEENERLARLIGGYSLMEQQVAQD